ncbi:hypothetical protein yinte0001_10490 [Yersinia intermedia ATCC 29909]|nr:hypothetical protein yinte0001_10490 [Yersinia intermedia ATCC 29909]
MIFFYPKVKKYLILHFLLLLMGILFLQKNLIMAYAGRYLQSF